MPERRSNRVVLAHDTLVGPRHEPRRRVASQQEAAVLARGSRGWSPTPERDVAQAEVVVRYTPVDVVHDRLTDAKGDPLVRRASPGEAAVLLAGRRGWSRPFDPGSVDPGLEDPEP